MSDVKVYGYIMRIKESLKIDNGIFCTSMDKAVLHFPEQEAEEKILRLRSGDVVKHFYKDDGYTYIASMSINEDRIISEKEGVRLGYRLAFGLIREKENKKDHE